MHLMTTSLLFCTNVFLFRKVRVSDFASKRRKICVRQIVLSAKRGHGRKRRWWEKLFLEEDDEEDVLGHNEEGEELSENEKFESWKRRAEAITELREAQEDARNAEARAWEDWIGDGYEETIGSSWDNDLGEEGLEGSDEFSADPVEIMGEKGFSGATRNSITGKDDYELLFEDRVFQFASTSSVYESILQTCIIYA